MSPTVRKRTDSVLDRLAGARRRDRRHRHQQAAPPHHLALVREVEVGQRQLLARDVLPDVELGPVGDREHAEVLALVDAGVVQVPQLRALVLRVPLAEAVAEREDALLRARLLLVAPRAADQRVEAELVDRFEQRHRLRRVARSSSLRSLHGAARDRILDRAHDQPLAQLRGARVAERRSPRGSCGRCRCAAAGTEAARAGTPSRRGAARRSYPCRRRRAAPASRSGPRPRAGCGSLRIRATRGDRGAGSARLNGTAHAVC